MQRAAQLESGGLTPTFGDDEFEYKLQAHHGWSGQRDGHFISSPFASLRKVAAGIKDNSPYRASEFRVAVTVRWTTLPLGVGSSFSNSQLGLPRTRLSAWVAFAGAAEMAAKQG